METTEQIPPARKEAAGAPAPAPAAATAPDVQPRAAAQMRGLKFTPAQNKLATAAISTVAFSVMLLFAVALAMGLVKFLGWVSPAVTPLFTAFALSVLFRPFYEFLKHILRNPFVTVAAMVCIVAVPVALVSFWYGEQIASQVAGFIESVPDLLEKAGDSLNENMPEAKRFAKAVGAPDAVQAFLNDPHKFAAGISEGDIISVPGAEGLGLKLASGARVVFSALLTLIFFVCFLTMPQIKGPALVRYLPMLKESTAQFVAEQIDKFFDILSGFFCRQVVICLLEGCLYGAGFKFIAGLPHGFLIGFTLGTLNIVPFFGSVVGLAVALPLAFLTMGDGGPLCAALVCAVWGAGQILDGWLITPVIQGNKTKLSYPAIIFSFLFWGTVFNTFLGMLLAIPMSAFCKVLWDSIRKKIKGFI